MTPAELAAIRERAAESPLGKSTTRMLDQAILDRRALLDHIDNMREGRDLEQDMLATAVKRITAALGLHRPVWFSFSWQNGVTTHDPCPECHDKAGTHPCGCHRPTDEQHMCAACSDPYLPDNNGYRPWPCPTVKALTSN